MEPQQEVKKSKKGVFGAIVTILLTAVIVAGVTAYSVMKFPKLLGLSKGSAQIQAEIDSLLTEVGKLIALPTDEKPTVATVSDIEKVKDQPFFKNALNGDKILIFANARKAILYRPSEKKIVEVGAVNINKQTVTETPAPSLAPKLPVTN